MKPPFPKWPLIVRWPGLIKPEVQPELASTLDVPATILVAAGVKPPVALHGRDRMDVSSASREYIFASRD